MNLVIIIFILFFELSYSQEIIVVGNSDINNIEYISASLTSIDVDHRVWDNYSEQILIDSLLVIKNSILLWECDSSISNNILENIHYNINQNNSFLLFSNNINNNDVLSSAFGFIKIRDNFSNSIKNLYDDQNYHFYENSNISELSWIGDAYPKFVYSETNAYSSIHKNFSNGRTLFSGYNLDQVLDLSIFLNDLLNAYKSYYNKIDIKDIDALPNDTLLIPISINSVNDIEGLSIKIQSDPDFLYFIDMELLEGSNIVWDINPLPFGIVEVNGAVANGVIEAGQSDLGYLKALLYPSSTNKISLRGIENLITYSNGESSSALFDNGEIDILYDYSILELIPPSLIMPDSIGNMDISLSTDHHITAIQLCIEYDANIIGINNISNTSLIPDSWFVSFVNHPVNNISEIFCFGFEPIGPLNGPIINVELESYSQSTSISSINFCDILLAGIDSDNIDSYGIDTEIIIDNPDLIISPSSIITDNYIDILFNISSHQAISGFQFDFNFDNNLDLLNVTLGNISTDFMGSWTLLNENKIRVVYFNDEYNNLSPIGNLLTSNYSFNENVDQFNFNISNVIITDQNYDVLSVDFNDFYIENQFSMNGDANGNFSIDIYDIVLIVSHIIGLSNFGNAQEIVVDSNNDSFITIEDILIILNEILNE